MSFNPNFGVAPLVGTSSLLLFTMINVSPAPGESQFIWRIQDIWIVYVVSRFDLQILEMLLPSRTRRTLHSDQHAYIRIRLKFSLALDLLAVPEERGVRPTEFLTHLITLRCSVTTFQSHPPLLCLIDITATAQQRQDQCHTSPRLQVPAFSSTLCFLTSRQITRTFTAFTYLENSLYIWKTFGTGGQTSTLCLKAAALNVVST